MTTSTQDFIPKGFATVGARLVGAYEPTDCPHCGARRQTASTSCGRCDTYIRSSEG